MSTGSDDHLHPDSEDPLHPGTLPGQRPRRRSTMRLFASCVLALEALLVFFAVLVARVLSDLPSAAVWGSGLALSAACVLTIGLLRVPAGYGVGTVLQGALLASGLVVPAMFLMGGLFAFLWGCALVLGGRVDREKLARDELAPEKAEPDAGA